MKVLKFGGTSVKNAENINKAITIVKDNKSNVIVVVSALGGITNLLIDTAKSAKENDGNHIKLYNQIKKRHLTCATTLGLKLDKKLNEKLTTLKSIFSGIHLLQELTNKTLAKVSAYGEELSALIVATAMQKNKLNVNLVDSKSLIVTKENEYLNAKVDFKKTSKKIIEYFKNNKYKITITSGFVATNNNNETTTLGRGGSDYSAAIFAKIINAKSLEIWTDVSGMFTANPMLVKQAKTITQISYQEAMELSHFGAKVIYPPTIHPVLEKNIPIYIKNTFKPKDEGTLITKKTNHNNIASGITHIDHVSLITLEGNAMVGVPGFSKRLFESLANNNINVKLITQASSEHSICIGIDSANEKVAKQEIDKVFAYEILTKKVKPLLIENKLAIIALVGDNMKSHQGISGKMFSSLGKNNVNIRAIAQGASEKNISAVINSKNVKKALNSLHETFFETQYKTLNLFIIGVGNVGSIFINQLKIQQKYLLDKLQLKLNVVGLANSKKMCFKTDGIHLNTWKKSLEKGEKSDLKTFFTTITNLNLRNSIFVDNTANESITKHYKFCLNNSISVVASNKIACSSAYKNYIDLKNTAKEYNASFLFETNVGAGLPIIDTLKNLINSGDRILKIQAILSGSLNFIFNNYNAKKTFHEIVNQAGIEGYTEPDPRIDLSGVDVMRKILILARESGYQLEMKTIKNNSFLPKNASNTKSVAEFLSALKKEEDFFKNKFTKTNKKGNKLKYVAEFSPNKTQVGLQEVASDHPFYNIDGKDNIVLFYTERYKEQPLIIKGAGAGAEVTASGIFADVIRVASK